MLTSRSGYTIVELMLALVISGMVLAGAYATYTALGRVQQVQQARAQVQGTLTPTLNFLARHVRQAGFTLLDDMLDPVNGTMPAAIAITDSGNACCDSLTLLMDDEDAGNRRRIRFYVLPHNGENALFMDIEELSGGAWNMAEEAALVATRIDDFQAEIIATGASGLPKTVTLSLVAYSRRELAQNRAYDRPDWLPGNYDFTRNDRYLRNHMMLTVSARNVK